MPNKRDDSNQIKASPAASSPTNTTSLSNILSSVLRLHSSSSHKSDAPKNTTTAAVGNGQQLATPQRNAKKSKNDRIPCVNNAFTDQYPQSPTEMEDDEIDNPSLIDFSKTLNTATRSAQNITQDIDMLQMNIESLANNLGIDPGQFDEDLEADRCFQDNYSNMINSSNTADRAKLYAIADSNADLDKKNLTVYDHKKEQQQQNQQQQQRQQMGMMNSTPYNFDFHHTTSRQYSQQARQAQPKQSMPPYSVQYNGNQNLPQPPKLQPIQPTQRNHDINNGDGTYSQLLSMNYSDSFGPNYPSSSGDTATNANAAYDDNNDQQQQRAGFYQANGTNNEAMLPPGPNSSEYNAMVNDYTEMMRPSYYNNATNDTYDG